MAIEVEKLGNLGKIKNPYFLQEVFCFSQKLDKLLSKNEIVKTFLETVNLFVNPQFCSFVEKDMTSLKVLCQIGDSSLLKNVFTRELSYQIYDWVLKQNQFASFKLSQGGEQFIFIPLVDPESHENIEHGLLVLFFNSSYSYPSQAQELTRDVTSFINVLAKLTSQTLTKLIYNSQIEKYKKLFESNKLDLELTSKIQNVLSVQSSTEKISFDFVNDKDSNFNGNTYWISQRSKDENILFLLCEITPHCIKRFVENGASSAFLGGYILGKINDIQSKNDILLNPKDILLFLNKELNPVFKSTGMTVNALYGVINPEKRKIRFASANYPAFFMIGPEEQIINLDHISFGKNKILGVNLNTSFEEVELHTSGGSKLIICNSVFLDHTSKIGEKYDPGWLVQILETLGSLTLKEMKNSLVSILSEHSDGTALNTSRQALLLEIKP